jgi:hypothetical protein
MFQERLSAAGAPHAVRHGRGGSTCPSLFQERLSAAGAPHAVRHGRRGSTCPSLLVLLVVGVALHGCGHDAFRLLQTTPEDVAADVQRDGHVLLVFSEAVDGSRLEVSLSPEAPIQPPEVDAGRVTVRPVELWAADTAYTLTVRAQGTEGEPLSGPASVRFTTGRAPLHDSERPPEVHFSPSSGLAGVRTDAVLELTFSHPMDVESVARALTVEPAVGCQWQWTADRTRSTCTPVPRLSLDTAYTLRLAPAARRERGGPMLASEVVRSFRTLPAPALTRVTPVDDARGVPRGSSITLDFSHGMQCESVRRSFRLLGPDGVQVPGTLHCASPDVAHFVPGAGATRHGETYQWVLDAGVLDAVGDATSAAATGRFTVARLGTTTLAAVVDGTGTVAARGGRVTDTAVLRIGRDARVGELRALLTFDVSALPEGTVSIEEATLRFTQQGVVGDPYGDYGTLYGGHVSAGSLDATDFQASPYMYRSCDWLLACINKPRRYALATAGGNITRGLSVLTAAQVALSERKPLQFLLHFESTGSEPEDQSVELASASADPALAPALVVRYQYP